ncbi:MAG: ABC transporter ATP-binding protein [Candidatus Saccharimonadales bacterium]
MITPNQIISVKELSKSFVLPHHKKTKLKDYVTHPITRNSKEVQYALSDINFSIDKGEFVGIVGRNGSGKSTLLKCLAGVYAPSEGSIYVGGKLVPFIELGVGFNHELSGKDNVYLNGALLGFSTQQMNEMYDDIVEFAELEHFMDQKLKNYSSGMQVRLAFSIAIRVKSDILLIDEVLAVGDANFQRKCFSYFDSLKSSDTTVVFVSHDMEAVKRFCDKAILLEEGKLIAIDDPQEIAANYFESNRKKLEDEASQGSKPVATGTKQAEIKEVVLTDQLGKQRKTYSAGQDINVELKIAVNADIEERTLAGIVVNNDDTAKPQFWTNTKWNDVPVPNLKKGDEISITFHIQNIFPNGEYSVECAFKKEDREDDYSRLQKAASFKVVRNEKNAWLYHPNVSVEISRPSL